MITNVKSKVLLTLASSMIVFGISLTMMVLDVNLLTRIAALLAVFVSGFGCCSIGYMLKWDETKNKIK